MAFQISSKWRILGVTMFVLMLDYGFIFVLGTIFRTMLDKFDESRSKTATLQSLYVGVTFMTTILSGLFVSKFGVCYGITCTAVLLPLGFFASYFAESMVFLFVSIGIVAGVGNSFALMSCVVAVGQSFPEHQRSLAMSILFTSVGITTLVYPYFMSWLVHMFGLNGTFLVLSALYLHTFAASVVYRYEINVPIEINPETNRDEKSGNSMSNVSRLSADLTKRLSFSVSTIEKSVHNSDTNVNENSVAQINNDIEEIRQRMADKKSTINGDSLLSPIYLIFALSSAIMLGNCTGFLSVAQDIFVDKGLTEAESLSGFLAYNLASVIVRLVPAFTAKLGWDTFVMLMISSVFGVAGQLIIYLFSSHVALLIGSGLSGAAFGEYAACIPIKTFELLGVNKQAIGYGIIVTACGVLTTGFGPLFGAIRDSAGEYTTVLITSTSLNGLCCVLILIVMVMQRLRQKKPTQTRRLSVAF